MLEKLVDHSPPRRVAGLVPLIALIACSASASAAIRVQLMNLSPRTAGDGGAVSLQVSGQPAVSSLVYRHHSEFITLPDTNFTITARDENGAVLVTQDFQVLDRAVATQPFQVAARRDYVVALIGNGTTRPFGLFYGLQHAEIVPDDQFSVQLAYLATQGSFEDPVLRFSAAAGCDAPDPPVRSTGASPPHDDFLGFDGAFPSVQMLPANVCNRAVHVAVHHNSPQRDRLSAEFSASPGERLRIFAIGDGQLQPFESLVVRYGIEPTKPFVNAAAGMDGLWLDPEQPGKGIAVMVDPAAPFNPPTLLYYSFDDSSANTWAAMTHRQLEEFQLQTYLGGSPDGQAPTRVQTVGPLKLRFHSCREASFVTTASHALITHTEMDVMRARSLFKLLPLDDCATTGAAP